MERVQNILLAFLSVFFFACNTEQPLPSSQTSLKCTILSRGENSPQYLPTGSKILVNAHGGLIIENETFTYNGHVWESNELFQWANPLEETYIIALYPTYTDNNYTTENLYSNGTLEDVLIARKTLSEKETIELQFAHLFSQLTIHIEDEIQEKLKEIQLITPVKIETVSPEEGTFSIMDEPSTSILCNNGSTDYLFIIPPGEECVLTLVVIMSDDTVHEISLAPTTFKSGTGYKCNLLNTDTRPGIRTAEDLIAFSQLINGTYDGDKTLDDFGEQIGEETVYYLLNDIELTEEDCSQFSPIGMKDSNPFSYTFDGKGHTIFNFILPEEDIYKKSSGLFGYIASTGKIQDLHLSNAASTQTPSYNNAGILAYNNMGIIDHCSISNSTVYSAELGNMGLICCLSSGSIINSYTKNNTIHVAYGSYAGAICSSANGNILNCYSRLNKFSTSEKSYRASGITASSITKSRLNIENCYTYYTQFTASYWGNAISVSNNVSIDHFYSNAGKTYYGTATNTTSSNVSQYDTQYNINSTHVSTFLNEWIETTGTTRYPQFVFKYWTTAEDGSPCFMN